MNPKHHNPTRPRPDQKGREFWARAPYNFVPLPEKVAAAESVPPQDQYYSDRYTGRIECVLTTQSPLYTRTALNPDFFQQWAEHSRKMMADKQARETYAQFFRLDDAQRPVIPGSSLRGMIRSLVEIFGYGKIQWVTKEPLFFRAVADTTSLGQAYREKMKPLAVKAGVLQSDGHNWHIRPAKPIDGKPFARIKHRDIPKVKLTEWAECKNAWKIYIQTARLRKAGMLPLISLAFASPAHQLQEAILVKTGHMQGKTKDFVLGLPDEKVKPEAVPEKVIHAYLTDANRLGKENALRNMQPVFFLLEGKQVTYFGDTMMFRLPYPQTPFDLIPAHLRSESDVDLAEAIFGYSPERSRREGQAGRVFFTDARFESAQDGVWLSDQPITPSILGSPKPTTFQHYLTQQEPDDKRRLDHYDSPPPHKTVIRGHKLYWHKGTVGLRDLTEKDDVDWSTDTQHTQIKPVKAGVTFRSQIHFENLSKAELGALLWVLTLPGETGKQYCLKLGMGKPLGMGAVKIAPILHLSNRQDRYSRLFEYDRWYQAEKITSDVQPFIQAFEEYVLTRMDKSEREEVKSLKEVERFRMLLKMLEWPGPDSHLTQYMRIEEPVNEYKERPVLPDPLNIGQPASTPTQVNARPGTGRDRNPKRHQRR